MSIRWGKQSPGRPSAASGAGADGEMPVQKVEDIYHVLNMDIRHSPAGYGGGGGPTPREVFRAAPKNDDIDRRTEEFIKTKQWYLRHKVAAELSSSA